MTMITPIMAHDPTPAWASQRGTRGLRVVPLSTRRLLDAVRVGGVHWTLGGT